MYFLRREEKDSQTPSDDFLLDLADWLHGCHGCTSITVKFDQSGGNGNSAPPFSKNNINILTFLLGVFDCSAAPPRRPNAPRLCAASKKDSSVHIVKCLSSKTRSAQSPFRALEINGFAQQNDTSPLTV